LDVTGSPAMTWTIGFKLSENSSLRCGLRISIANAYKSTELYAVLFHQPPGYIKEKLTASRAFLARMKLCLT